MYNQIQKFLFHNYLQPNEKVLHTVHRHFWSIWFGFTWRFLFFIFLPLIAYVLFPHEYVLYGMIAAVFIGILWIAYIFVDWYSDVFLLTNKNLVSINWGGIFKRDTVRIKYEEIESVEVKIEGVAQTVFKFGHIKIETANENVLIFLKDASHPSRAQGVIISMRETLLEEHDQLEVGKFKQALYEFIEEQKERFE